MVLAMAISMAMSGDNVATLKKRGLEVIEQIRREYYLPESKLYCEEIEANGKKSGPCFNWGAGVMLSALNSAAKADPKYKAWLREYADASRVYWNDKGPVPGYDVLPAPKPIDRYYDDNAWMVLALVETYEILGDKKYLDWAEESLTYVLSGWDEKLGGGIYWRESDKASKNTCANAPSAAACLAVAKYRQKAELKSRAEKIMVWTDKSFRDPADGLYWDGMNLSGKVEKTKWTYNTGLSIRSWFELSPQVKIDSSSLEETIKSAEKRWFDDATGAAKDEGKFAHLLFEGFKISRKGDSALANKMNKALDYLFSQVRGSNGRYGHRWDKPFDPNQKKFALIDQASAARGYLYASQK